MQLRSRVCIRDQDGDAEFYVVPHEEADAVADRVSVRSPLGRALLGRRVGDVVRFRVPASGGGPAGVADLLAAGSTLSIDRAVAEILSRGALTEP